MKGRRDLFWRHVRSHWFEYVLDLIGPVLFTGVVLYLCGTERFGYGMLLAGAYSFGKVVYRLHCFKKDYLDADVK